MKAKAMFTKLIPESTFGKRIAAGSAFIGASLVLSLSIFATGPSPEPKEHTEKAWPVSTTPVVITDIAPVLRTYGRVESSNVASLGVDVIAPVAAVHVHEGQWVEAGVLLVELDQTELQLRLDERMAELQQAEAALRSIKTEYDMTRKTTSHFEAVHRIAQSKLERHEELFEQRMISQAVFDEVVSQSSESTIQYQQHMRALADFPNRIAEQEARAMRIDTQVKRAEIDVAKSRLVAPFAGPVLAVDAAPGDRTQPGRPLVRIAASAKTEIRSAVPDRYTASFRQATRLGQPLRATANVDGFTTHLILDRLGSNVKSGHSGLDAFFRIDNARGKRGPEIGRVVDVTIELPTENDVVALPAQAIYEGDRVYRVEDDRLRSVSVARIGEVSRENLYQVLVRATDLAQGDQVITTQLPKAITGLRVEVAGELADDPSDGDDGGETDDSGATELAEQKLGDQATRLAKAAKRG